MQIFVIATILISSPWTSKLSLLYKTFDHFCQYAGTGILSVLLLSFNLNSEGGVIKKDLEMFEKLYYERFKISLNDENICFE